RRRRRRPRGRTRLVAHGTCAVNGHANRRRPQPGMTSTGSIIYLEDVTVSYDGFKALSRLNFYMDRRELRVVIGPNGAGKTTLLDVISGRGKHEHGRGNWGVRADSVPPAGSA